MVALVIESWIWYGFVILVAASRLFQPDDWLIGVILWFYTAMIISINVVANHNSNLLPPGFDVNTLTPDDIEDRTLGSKMILVVEQCQCVTIWGAKISLLILYLRLTNLQSEHRAVQVLLGYVCVTFFIMEILYFGVWCRPFYNYWAVPTPNIQCDAATNHLITNAVFNLSSDLAMLIIGLPMFLRMNLPLRKKIPLVGVFSLGVFVVLAAILNKVYSFSQPFGSEWTFWYVRESSTALLVANLPFVWRFWRIVTGANPSQSAMYGTHATDQFNTHLESWPTPTSTDQPLYLRHTSPISEQKLSAETSTGEQSRHVIKWDYAAD